MPYHSTTNEENIIGHQDDGLITQLTGKRSRRRLIILILFALLSLIACSDSGVVTQESQENAEKGNIIAEEHIGDSIISLFDNVLVNLEPENAQVGPNDTGSSGYDQWLVRISRTQNITLRIENLPNLTLSMRDSEGNELAAVISENSSKNVLLKKGTYQIVVHNEGSESNFFWTGWRDEGETTEPSICAAQLDNAPPSAAFKVPTGIPLFVTPTNSHSFEPTRISSYKEFAEKFKDYTDSYLDDAIRLYFINGASTAYAYIVGVSGESPEAYREAISLSDHLLGSKVQIVVTPETVDLSVSDWGKVVRLLTESIAMRAMLIVDPPKSAREYDEIPELRAVLPSTPYAAAYFPWLIDEDGKHVPPSGAMAGIWSRNDEERGFWNAPANLRVFGVQGPEIEVTEEMQGDLNVPLDGKAFDAIREFVGRGTVVWGARTLDGNSNDYRYIQVVRNLTYIYQSLDPTLKEFEYAPNDEKTWTTIVSVFSKFLNNLWAEGGLMGDTASEAYSVTCGIGSTMTAQDILEGKLIVKVKLQMIGPAEYLNLIFVQKML